MPIKGGGARASGRNASVATGAGEGQAARSLNRPGYFGAFGGRYVAETLIPALDALAVAYASAMRDTRFAKDLDERLKNYVGRPTPLTFAENLSTRFGFRVFLKREDLAHTGAHKINNCVGQILLARRMGKKRVIAETGAGQHGVATATVAALMGCSCDVFMGRSDMARQAPNVARMRLLGARVVPVDSGSRTLKDALNEALRDWVTNVKTTYYLIGSVAGPHPYPTIVRDFQTVIGLEARRQIVAAAGRLPDAVVACVGGGSNAAGIFSPFVLDKGVALVGVEAAGAGLATGRHAATLTAGRVGVLHGSKSYVLQDDGGQVRETHSISAGLDYPGVGPEHAFWKESGRVKYVTATDDEALAAVEWLARDEGIIPALESAHAIAALKSLGGLVSRKLPKNAVVVVNVSGRGDKDLATIVDRLKLA